jgi:hypothetical protein
LKVTLFALNELVNSGLLAPAGEGAYPVWMVPPASDLEPNPPYGYVVSFIWLHEYGFTAPTSNFMRGLCYQYRVELHNFAPNAISQVAIFVGIYEGFLGIPVNWIFGCTCSARSCTPLTRVRRERAGRFAPAA